MPWALKIIAKIILSRLPVSYRRWTNLGLFKLGSMANPNYAIKIFFLHLENAFGDKIPDGKVFLEMGSGDSVASALIAASIGAKKIYLVDAGDFATRDMRFYCALTDTLRKRGLKPPHVTPSTSFSHLLELCHAEYLTEGLSSWGGIPSGCVDYAWSHSTLEHIRRREFGKTMNELYRAMVPGGIVSHNIDLKDHLGGNLNNLRFPEKLWEAEWMARSGFYTNRLRASEIKTAFSEAGFSIVSFLTGSWDKLSTPQAKMAFPFSGMAIDDLLIRSLSVLLLKPS